MFLKALLTIKTIKFLRHQIQHSSMFHSTEGRYLFLRWQVWGKSGDNHKQNGRHRRSHRLSLHTWWSLRHKRRHCRQERPGALSRYGISGNIFALQHQLRSFKISNSIKLSKIMLPNQLLSRLHNPSNYTIAFVELAILGRKLNTLSQWDLW